MIRNIRMTLSCAVVLSMFLAAHGCKKQGTEENSGIVTFKLGSAKIQHTGGQPADIQLKDMAGENDIITTGEKSTVVLQFSNNCVVRINEGSTFKVISAIKNNRTLLVKNGQALIKLMRTGDNNATVKTPTAIAGVRGTQFSVSYKEGRSQIAVSNGKVAVMAARTDDTGKTISETRGETLTEEGKTAEIIEPEKKSAGKEAQLVVSLRPIDALEKQELKKIEIMPLIPDVGKKAINEIESTMKKVDEIKREIESAELQGKLKQLLEKKTCTIDEIREVFSQIDEVSLYNGRTIKGAIMTRGENFTILTTEGTVSVPAGDIKGTRIIK